MGRRYKAYPEYKDSGVEWLKSLPDHWEAKKLKFIAEVQPSNVDKKTKDGEQPVLLCNYTDVYYNDSVNSSLDFMKASATEDQISKFSLKAGDIIITKDSEDPRDIAIPTFVPATIPGVVCGYHLSMIRTYDKIYGSYIKRVFESSYANAYFSTRANGLTRYGLGTYPLDNVFFPKPPKEEAVQIANFLDHETAKIDTLIEKQQQLIKLLKGKRQAVISHAVTKGLNPDAPMKDSGVEWLGEVPEHWEVLTIKHIVSIPITDGPHETPEFFDEGIPFVSAEAVSSGTINFEKIRGYISYEDNDRFSKKYIPQLLDIYMVKSGATTGVTAIVEIDSIFNIWSPLAVIRCKADSYPYFVLNFLRSFNFQEAIQLNWSFGTQQNIGMGVIENLYITRPPYKESLEIVNYLNKKNTIFEDLINKANKQIILLQERRTALISSAVTGKIDVRDWKNPGDVV